VPSGVLLSVAVGAVDARRTEGMLSREDVVEVVALHRRGWSISAIARHTGRDRKTVRAWLRGERQRRPRPPSVLEPFRDYVARRFEDDPHLDATVLFTHPTGSIRAR
jgi:IS30 family transposase